MGKYISVDELIELITKVENKLGLKLKSVKYKGILKKNEAFVKYNI